MCSTGTGTGNVNCLIVVMNASKDLYVQNIAFRCDHYIEIMLYKINRKGVKTLNMRTITLV